MNALLDHVWGRSPGADRVWAQVTGMTPALAARQYFMTLQAFFDDSYTPGGTFVLGGHVATAEAWAQFSPEWEGLVEAFGARTKDGERHFKMKYMTRERLPYVEKFFRVIEKHVAASVHIMLNASDLERAKARIWIPGKNIDWGFTRNPYLVLFRGLLDAMCGKRELMDDALPPDAQINFIFDNQTEKKVIWKVWDAFVESRPDAYKINLRTAPRFEDDRQFPPLQAADFWAWWVRKWYEDGTPERHETMNFNGLWRVERKDFPRLAITYDEDRLVKLLIGLIGSEYPGVNVWDLAKPPNPKWPLGTLL